MSRTYRRRVAIVAAGIMGLSFTACSGSDEQTEPTVTACNYQTKEFEDVAEAAAEQEPYVGGSEVCDAQEKIDQKASDKAFRRELAQQARAVSRASDKVTEDVKAASSRTDKLLAVVNRACRHRYELDQNDIDFMNGKQVEFRSAGLDSDLLEMYVHRYRNIWRPSVGPAQLPVDMTKVMKWACPGRLDIRMPAASSG